MIARMYFCAALSAAALFGQLTVWTTGANGRRVEGNYDFGEVESGKTVEQPFEVRNTSSGAVPLQVMAVAGRTFTLVADSPLPALLAANAAAPFSIRFQPESAGSYLGLLNISGGLFTLAGTAVPPVIEPAPMKFEIRIEPASLRSGQQGKLSVRLLTGAEKDANGEVKMEFFPSVAAPADPAILFLSGSQTAPFKVAKGDESGQFGTRSEIEFQTGTTAGSLVFTAQLDGQLERVSLPLERSAPVLEPANVSRTSEGIEVRLTGFDNARCSTRAAFAFYDGNGAALPGGTVEADAATEFTRYFSTSAAGGVFALKAQIPVRSGASVIREMDASLKNCMGETRTERTRF
jgi:hypothetical protein